MYCSTRLTRKGKPGKKPADILDGTPDPNGVPIALSVRHPQIRRAVLV